ncbi:MFS transporter [Vibrio genomosp. F10]|uniref:MFS transporter n=1 Tax=Vibrio genomosp. F10 TaxID=723171 RepID=UPI0002F0B6F1|nr:MFS transporter [Vibrio genomosp. F10]OEF09617.1 hypothetical protein A1QK_05865 [Vibrio genomosp. F10 str. 9ZD137]
MSLKMPRNFFFVRIGELFTSLSTRMIVGGLSWYCISVLSNAAMASMLYGGFYLFKLIFGVLLSPLGDSFNKKNLLIISSATLLGSSLLMLLGFYADIAVVSIVIGILIISFGDSYLSGIVNAIIPEIIPKHLVERAYQNTFILQSVANIIGIAMGVTVIETFGISFILGFSLVLSGISIVLFSLINYKADVITNIKFTTHSQDIIEGVKLSYKYKTEFYWNLISSLSNLAVVPLVGILVPYYVSMVVEKQAIYVATLELSLTIGVFLAATYVQPILSKRYSKISLVQSAFVGISISMALLAFSNSLLAWHIGLLTLGVSIVVNNISIESVRAVAIPQEFRARLQVVHQLFIQSSIPFGFYIFSFKESQDNLVMILYSFSVMFLIFSFLIPMIPQMKILLSKSSETLDGAYADLFEAK